MALLGWRSRGGKPRIVPLGDSALIAEFSTQVDLEVNARIQRVAAAIRERAPAWVRDVVPSAAALAVHFDANAVAALDLDAADARIAAARQELRELIESCVTTAGAKGAAREPDVLELPVCYGGEYGMDLEAVAEKTGLAPEDVIRRHTSGEHTVLMVGFAPGHPYIGGLDRKLSVPRRATPRIRVPEGSVAIANAQTAVYPFVISGGWNIIGRTPLRIFDERQASPALFAPGQHVRFVPIDAGEFDRLHGLRNGRG